MDSIIGFSPGPTNANSVSAKIGRIVRLTIFDTHRGECSSIAQNDRLEQEGVSAEMILDAVINLVSAFFQCLGDTFRAVKQPNQMMTCSQDTR